MTDSEYRDLLETLQNAARTWALMLTIVIDADLKTAAEAVETADAVGWVVDPTKYRDRLQDGGIARQRDLIAATRAYRAALRELFPQDAVILGAKP